MDNLDLTELDTVELPAMALDLMALASHLQEITPASAIGYCMGFAAGSHAAAERIQAIVTRHHAHLSRLRRAEGVTVEQDWRAR